MRRVLRLSNFLTETWSQHKPTTYVCEADHVDNFLFNALVLRKETLVNSETEKKLNYLQPLPFTFSKISL